MRQRTFPVRLTAQLLLSLCIGLLPCVAGSPAAHAAESPIMLAGGASRSTAAGDYISSRFGNGLESTYRFYVEVPSAAGNLVVDVFDADITSPTGNWDILSGGASTDVRYELFDPTGASRAAVTLVNGACAAPFPAGCNNAWATLFSTANPAPGHWLLEVDTSNSGSSPPGSNNGNDVNGYRVRAHDGDPSAGGVEIPIYAESFVPTGFDSRIPASQGSAVTGRHQLYPYLTKRCDIDINDWDADGQGSIDVVSRSGAFSMLGLGVSGSTAWLNQPFDGWRNCSDAFDYGLWDVVMTLTAGTANYGVFSAADQDAADPSGNGPIPTTQPQASSLRIYFTADGGGAPVKPFLTQQVTHVAGPNPPQDGVASQFAVTVRLSNPTTSTLTFAAPGDAISVEVPSSAGQVELVAGTVSVTTGAVTPPAGSNGTIAWDPGTVAPGSDQLLTYRVRVTPSLGGPDPIEVTGTPAGGDGTRATYIDETCSGATCGAAELARARFDFGPLCELAVKRSAPTLALIESFTVSEESGRRIVEWETLSEIGTVGFELYRLEPGADPEPVVGGLVPSLETSVEGARYRVVDPAGGERARYMIVELEGSGARRLHGPFDAVERSSGLSREPMIDRFLDRSPRHLQRAARRPSSDRSTATAGSRTALGPSSRLKILVEEEGLYRLESSRLAEALEIPRPRLERAIAQGRIALSNAGRPVHWQASYDSSALYFFGRSLDSIYARANVYWLELRRGSRVRKADGGSPWPRKGGYFASRTSFEENAFAATAVSTDPESDYWYWAALSAGNSELEARAFAFDVAHPAAARGRATVRVRLASATTVGIADEHRVEVTLNGRFLGEIAWSGLAPHETDLAFDSGYLEPTGNEIEVRAVLGEGVPYSIVYVDRFQISYPRYYRAERGALRLKAGGSRVVTVSGFETANLAVFDLSRPERPVRLENLSIDGAPGDNRVSFVPSGPGTDYLAVDLDRGALAPVDIRVDRPSDWLSPSNRADYLVIADDALADAAEALAALRESAGLTSRVALVEDLYDELNHGVASPHALRDFLATAATNWSQPPRFVALAGTGSFDYKNYAGLGAPGVPPLMISASAGLFASDRAFVPIGERGDALALGRIPAATNDELAAYVYKLEAYEKTPAADWQSRVLLLADTLDPQADYATDSKRLGEQFLPRGFSAQEIALDKLGLPAARTALFDALRSGAGVANYFGHGGLDRLSAAGLLTSGDVAELRNGERLPVLTAMTCAVNRFAVPGVEPLGSALVLEPEGGAAAVWSASGLSNHHEAVELAGATLLRALPFDRPLLGDSLREAVGLYVDRGGSRELLQLYNLLGDPALRLQTARSPEPVGEEDDL